MAPEHSTSSATKQTRLSNYTQPKLSKEMVTALNKKLLQMIVKDFQPFSIVEDVGFKNFISELNPSYHIPSRTFLTKKLLPQVYEERVNEVKQILSEANFVCLTTDAWTSLTSESFVSLTAHFISNIWQQKKFGFKLF
ncbi:zinc finger BED domain-containing protein 1-like [Rhagoletis pomonella]|uniref:zinc finger BED domain-containing protein 1-like n=1 Tax=Rhagoletis pomonella TaxID=28610 RepID=UPI00177C5FA8|nr:zinc finger BED domain-containing protein 1-like [Rhagoletis pomonella]